MYCWVTVHTVYLEKGTKLGTAMVADINVEPKGDPNVSALSSLGERKETTEVDGLPMHLVPLVTDTQLEKEPEKEKLAKLLGEYAHVFIAPGESLGRTDTVQHTIDTGENAPFK